MFRQFKRNMYAIHNQTKLLLDIYLFMNHAFKIFYKISNDEHFKRQMKETQQSVNVFRLCISVSVISIIDFV